MTRDKSLMHMIGGYSDQLEDDWALPTTQGIGLNGTDTEQPLKIENKIKTSSYASAVSLSNGDVLLTGGRTNSNSVFRLIGPDLVVGIVRSKMKHGRYGHASSVVVLGQKEHVIVAGGWDKRIPGRIHTSVEIYSNELNQWHPLPELPTARVFFNLQVISYLVECAWDKTVSLFVF